MITSNTFVTEIFKHTKVRRVYREWQHSDKDSENTVFLKKHNPSAVFLQSVWDSHCS